MLEDDNLEEYFLEREKIFVSLFGSNIISSILVVVKQKNQVGVNY